MTVLVKLWNHGTSGHERAPAILSLAFVIRPLSSPPWSGDDKACIFDFLENERVHNFKARVAAFFCYTWPLTLFFKQPSSPGVNARRLSDSDLIPCGEQRGTIIVSPPALMASSGPIRWSDATVDDLLAQRLGVGSELIPVIKRVIHESSKTVIPSTTLGSMSVPSHRVLLLAENIGRVFFDQNRMFDHYQQFLQLGCHDGQVWPRTVLFPDVNFGACVRRMSHFCYVCCGSMHVQGSPWVIAPNVSATHNNDRWELCVEHTAPLHDMELAVRAATVSQWLCQEGDNAKQNLAHFVQSTQNLTFYVTDGMHRRLTMSVFENAVVNKYAMLRSELESSGAADPLEQLDRLMLQTQDLAEPTTFSFADSNQLIGIFKKLYSDESEPSLATLKSRDCFDRV